MLPQRNYNLLDRAIVLIFNNCGCAPFLINQYQKKYIPTLITRSPREKSIRVKVSQALTGNPIGRGIIHPNGNLEIFDDNNNLIGRDILFVTGTSVFRINDSAYKVAWPDGTDRVPSTLEDGMELACVRLRDDWLETKANSSECVKATKVLTCLLGINKELEETQIFRNPGIQGIRDSIRLGLNFQEAGQGITDLECFQEVLSTYDLYRNNNRLPSEIIELFQLPEFSTIN